MIVPITMRLSIPQTQHYFLLLKNFSAILVCGIIFTMAYDHSCVVSEGD